MDGRQRRLRDIFAAHTYCPRSSETAHGDGIADAEIMALSAGKSELSKVTFSKPRVS